MTGADLLRIAALLRRLEWCIDVPHGQGYNCPVCDQESTRGAHNPGCELAAVIELVEAEES